MTHVDVDFARRLRIDTTSRARVEADVLDYLGGNFIKVRLNLRNMDKPVVCGSWRHEATPREHMAD